MKNDPIQEFILKSEQNLRIADAVGESWVKAREHLADGFLDRLEARLKKKLKGWEYCRFGSFFIEQWPGYYFWKPAWKDKYSIALQCGDYGKCVSYGIGRETNNIRKQPLREELLIAIQKLHPSAKSQVWWEAQVTMRSPASDWRKPDVLWRMKTDDKFLEDVAEQLLAVVKIGEPIIDKLMRKYRK